MKISGVQIEAVMKSYLRNTAGKLSENQCVQKKIAVDEVNISEESQLIMNLKESIANCPEIRHDLVKSIKQKLAGNIYDVKASEVADKMVSRILADTIPKD